MMKKGIYAILAALAVFALVLTGCPDGGGNSGGGDDLFKVTFSANGATGGTVPAALEQKTKGEALTIPGNTGNLVKTDYTFGGWNEKADGTGKTYAAGDKITPTKDTPLYAKWEGGSSGGLDLERAEKLSLANAWYAMYRFELPAGKTFADYKGMSAAYMFEEEELATATSRNARVMGPYEPSDFGFYTGEDSGTAAGKGIAIASYNGGKNAPYILDGGKIANGGVLVDELAAKVGVNAVGGEWFTYDFYVIDGSTKNGEYPADRLTALMASGGTLYFGLGLPSAGNDNINTYYIRDVKLLGYEAADDVTATALYFEKDGEEYPVYTGYPSLSGADGFAAAVREKLEFPSTIIPADAEKLSLANAWYAMYEFTLPAGKTFADYSGMSAEYMFTAEELATATSRNGRVMGPYVAGDFDSYTGEDSGTAAGKVIKIASYNGGKNAPYILDGGKIANGGVLVDELAAKVGVNAVGGEWFTYDFYVIDGSTKNGEYPADRLTALMASGGTLYFGLGLPSAGNDNVNTYFIKNIKLIGYEAADTISGTPLYLDNIPAYTGYPSVSGADGFDKATRGPAK